jgi:hypothetical protein
LYKDIDSPIAAAELITIASTWHIALGKSASFGAIGDLFTTEALSS